MTEKYLPVGTVVMLKSGQMAMMITGYKVRTETLEEYDYCGCIYPIGFTSDQKGTFNHDQIEKVIYMGYKDDNYIELNKKLLCEEDILI